MPRLSVFGSGDKGWRDGFFLSHLRGCRAGLEPATSRFRVLYL